MRRLITLCALFAAALGFAPPADSQLPPSSIVDRISQSVVRVEARQCPDGDRVGSGFLWPRNDSVVTAMHVVAGCREVAIYYEARRIGRDARVARVLRESDLALVQITDPPDLPSLVHAVGEPSLNEDLMAIGFFLGAPTMSSKALKMAYGSAVLKDMLPDKVAREIQGAGMPSLTLRILRLDGHLLHGLSGAPIINRGGAVVAIGNGGLENGAAAVSWALPAANLEKLMQSAEATTGEFRAARALFAASLESRPGNTVKCGGLEFTKMRTRSLHQLAESTDDPLGLQQLIGSAAMDLSGLQFDIYVSIDSGATIAVPAGTNLTIANGRCVARGSTGRLELHVQGAAVANLLEADTVSTQFENSVGNIPGLAWVPDPNWSYLLPQPRFDGMLVNRKTFNGLNLLTTQQTAAAFETLMTRGKAFTGLAVLNLAFSPEANLACQFAPALPACGENEKSMREWAAFVVGVFLSTFPIG